MVETRENTGEEGGGGGKRDLSDGGNLMAGREAGERGTGSRRL